MLSFGFSYRHAVVLGSSNEGGLVCILGGFICCRGLMKTYNLQALSVSILTATLVAYPSWCINKIHGPRSILGLSQTSMTCVWQKQNMSLQFASFCAIQVSNVIFLDSPVGAGFSYSHTEEGYKSSDTRAVNQILVFLKKANPSDQKNPN